MTKNILLSLFLLMNLSLLYLLKNKKQPIPKASEDLTQQQSVLNQVNALVNEKYWWELCSQQQQVQSKTLTSAMDNDSIQLADLVGQSPKLILRYSELHCDVCVDSTLYRLNKIAEKIGKENIIILSSYTNPRDMYTFKRLNEVKFPFYNLGMQNLGIKAEQADVPYFFVTDQSLKASMVFLAYKELPGELDKYFSILSQTIFNPKKNAKYQEQS